MIHVSKESQFAKEIYLYGPKFLCIPWHNDDDDDDDDDDDCNNDDNDGKGAQSIQR